VRRSHLPLVPAAMLLAAACSTGAGTTASPSTPPSTARASAVATRIEVKLLDTSKIEPASMTVAAGVPVTFVVTNAGATDHEFYLGDEAAQSEHEKEMVSMGRMTHDEPQGIAIKPGETKELTYTFAEAGETIAGCHVAGHYGGGMKAAITVGE
jgi:uncharacterized cupredoxin-like copper-binding protein